MDLFLTLRTLLTLTQPNLTQNKHENSRENIKIKNTWYGMIDQVQYFFIFQIQLNLYFLTVYVQLLFLFYIGFFNLTTLSSKYPPRCRENVKFSAAFQDRQLIIWWWFLYQKNLFLYHVCSSVRPWRAFEIFEYLISSIVILDTWLNF